MKRYFLDVFFYNIDNIYRDASMFSKVINWIASSKYIDGYFSDA